MVHRGCLGPVRRRVELLLTVPGISTGAAEVIRAEIDADIARFPTAGDLASWAGGCPGNHESASEQPTGKTRHGDPWFKTALGQAAVSAARTKDTCLAARYRCLAACRGKKRALVGLEHSSLVAVWHMLSRDSDYTDLGGSYFLQFDPDRAARAAVRKLHQLGYQVTLTPARRQPSSDPPESSWSMSWLPSWTAKRVP
ncbi:transposase [Streptomyces scopuliridis]|uniref:transposase n=1 Tax=Streptomyces scopuliridis TaxID=452529 RepID=UPI0036786E4D